MKNKNVLKKFVIYNLTDLKALEEDFTDMASKGWYIRSIRSGIFEYEKKEPSRLRYCVEIVPTADRDSNVINQKTAEYIELCEQTGWELVCSSAEVFVFSTNSEEIPAVTTDETEKLKYIQKTTVSGNKKIWSVALVGIVADLFLLFKLFVNSDVPFWIMIGVFWLGYLAMLIYKSLSFHKRYKVAINNNVTGNHIEYNGKEDLKKRQRLFYGFLAFVCVVVIGMTVWCFMSGHVGSAVMMIAEAALIALILIPLEIRLNKDDLCIGANVHISAVILMSLVFLMLFPVLMLRV